MSKNTGGRQTSWNEARYLRYTKCMHTRLSVSISRDGKRTRCARWPKKEMLHLNVIFNGLTLSNKLTVRPSVSDQFSDFGTGLEIGQIKFFMS
jgi:hypothetical protein